MAEENGFVSSGDARVDAALKRLEEKHDSRFRDLEDAMIVQAHLEASAGRRIKEHAELLADHRDAIKRHDDWMKHFEEKLDALTDIVMRREGGPEAQ